MALSRLGWRLTPPHASSVPLSGCQGVCLSSWGHLCPSVLPVALGDTLPPRCHSSPLVALCLPSPMGWGMGQPSLIVRAGVRVGSARANERSVRAQPRGPEPRAPSNGGLNPGATKFQIFEVHIRSDRSIQTAVQEEHVLSFPGQDMPIAGHPAGTTVSSGSIVRTLFVVNRVFLCELMAMLAMRFPLVEHPVRIKGVLHVLFVCPQLQMFRAYTVPVVA